MMIVFLIFTWISFVTGKRYTRCELAVELKMVHKAPAHQLATWVCIAEHESQYHTDVVGHMGENGTADHGIFQINDKYWCSPPGQGRACGLTCAQLEDDDITDDFKCAQKIYKEHKILSGDGFNAWVVYQPHCKGSKSSKYLKDCFNETRTSQPTGTGRPTWQNPHLFNRNDPKESKTFSSASLQDAFNQYPGDKLFTAGTTSRTFATQRSTVRTVFDAPRFTTKSTSTLRTSSYPRLTTMATPLWYNRINVDNQPANGGSFATGNRFKPATYRPLNTFSSAAENSLGTSRYPSNLFQHSVNLATTATTKTTTSNGSPVRSSTSNDPVFVFNGRKWYR